ncbi:hypothetical protein [Actinophytocola xinjiangensis]|nr:hypothetical protein [Actinophytocola xinjiangensis]
MIEINDGELMARLTDGGRGDRAISGHPHAAQIGTHFARVYAVAV